ncbi:hypothetical protein PINS_up022119 [Pythium insidiosum]|nr:hypothetical protein PINS_up018224 [Pythium insidiosum]GLE10124.1 hypothetical protein PINS_up022119 [Pythium insidiosum]
MVLPVIITGGVVVGGASGYAMYQVGKAAALPATYKEAPPKSFLGITLGGLAAGATYSAQGRLLDKHFAHLLTFEVPSKVENWVFRDFLRVTTPLIGTRVVMVSVAVAAMGFVTTKVDVLRQD